MVKIRCFVDTAPVLLAPEAAPLSFCYCWCQLCFRRGGKEEEKVLLLGGCFRDFGGFCSWQSVFSSSEFAHRFFFLLLLAIGSTDKRTDTHTRTTHTHAHTDSKLSRTLFQARWLGGGKVSKRRGRDDTRRVKKEVRKPPGQQGKCPAERSGTHRGADSRSSTTAPTASPRRDLDRTHHTRKLTGNGKIRK